LSTTIAAYVMPTCPGFGGGTKFQLAFVAISN